MTPSGFRHLAASSCAIVVGGLAFPRSGAGQVPTVRTPIAAQAGIPGVLTAGPLPQNISITGTPASAQLTWTVPVSPRGVFYAVKRWMESDLGCCGAQVSGLRILGWLDEGVQWPGTYVYRITAFYPDGTVGSVDAKWVRPDPINPTNVRGLLAPLRLNVSQLGPSTSCYDDGGQPTVVVTVPNPSPNRVRLLWDAVSGVSWYEVFGPGLPGGSCRLTHSTVGGQYLDITGLPPGNYTWRIGSYYSSPNAPAPVSTAASAFPSVTITLP